MNIITLAIIVLTVILWIFFIVRSRKKKRELLLSKLKNYYIEVHYKFQDSSDDKIQEKVSKRYFESCEKPIIFLDYHGSCGWTTVDLKCRLIDKTGLVILSLDSTWKDGSIEITKTIIEQKDKY